MRNRTYLLPIFCLLGAMVLWASSFIALKLAFAAYDPMVVIFGRMITASLGFCIGASFFRWSLPRREDLTLIGFMVVCEPCLYFLFEASALMNTSASQAGMITAMLPLMVAIAAGVYLKEVVTVRTIAGFIVAIMGACLLSLGAEVNHGAPNPVLGNFYEFMAMVFATGYTIALKRLSERYDPFFLTALQAFAGSIFYLPFLFLPSTTLPIRIDAVPAFSIAYLGIVVTMGAYGLYNYSVSKVPASQAAAFVNLIPVFTVILGWIVLGERFTPLQYVASGLVILGVFMSQDAARGKNGTRGAAQERAKDGVRPA
ncbi:MAG: DMT family transporter [Syntrophaceae bacterium]|nr:DMT family transporter [Deltaproteobacteria bacterium]